MEGGFVTTDDEELYHILISLRAHGWTRDLPKANMISNKSDDSFEESLRFILPSFKASFISKIFNNADQGESACMYQ